MNITTISSSLTIIWKYGFFPLGLITATIILAIVGFIISSFWTLSLIIIPFLLFLRVLTVKNISYDDVFMYIRDLDETRRVFLASVEKIRKNYFTGDYTIYFRDETTGKLEKARMIPKFSEVSKSGIFFWSNSALAFKKFISEYDSTLNTNTLPANVSTDEVVEQRRLLEEQKDE